MVHHRTTPLPNPPPQGGREQTEFAARVDSISLEAALALAKPTQSEHTVCTENRMPRSCNCSKLRANQQRKIDVKDSH